MAQNPLPQNQLPEQMEQQLRQVLTFVSDALRRARDGIPEKIEYKEQLLYTQSQVEKAFAHIDACLAGIRTCVRNLPNQST